MVRYKSLYHAIWVERLYCLMQMGFRPSYMGTICVEQYKSIRRKLFEAPFPFSFKPYNTYSPFSSFIFCHYSFYVPFSFLDPTSLHSPQLIKHNMKSPSYSLFLSLTVKSLGPLPQISRVSRNFLENIIFFEDLLLLRSNLGVTLVFWIIGDLKFGAMFS